MRISSETLIVFAATCLPIVLAPGPSVAFVVTTTLSSGKRTGLPAVAGVEIGYLFHVLSAAIGVSALLVASPEALVVVKLLGAGYLVWLAIKAWRSKDIRTIGELEAAPSSAIAPRGAFTRGLTIGVLNPKTAVFFLAFLPQFVNPATGEIVWQVIQLGIVFILMASVPDTAWVLASGAMRRFMRDVSFSAMERVSGAIYVGLAAFTLFAT